MDVDPSDPEPEQPASLDEVQYFIVPCDGNPRQPVEVGQDLGPVSEIPERQLTDDERVADNATLPEVRSQGRVPPPEVVDPYGGVG